MSLVLMVCAEVCSKCSATLLRLMYNCKAISKKFPLKIVIPQYQTRSFGNASKDAMSLTDVSFCTASKIILSVICQNEIGKVRSSYFNIYLYFLQDGEVWSPGGCEQCQCISGTVSCGRQPCNISSCPEGQVPLQLPEKCCPECVPLGREYSAVIHEEM